MEAFTFKIKFVRGKGEYSKYTYALINLNELETWRLSNFMTMSQAAKCFKFSTRTYQGLVSGTQKSMSVDSLKKIRDQTEHNIEFIKLTDQDISQ
jgi:predicted DNA-binding protein (UPF0251 family)